MSNKFWNVLVIAYYISILLLALIPMSLYVLFSNGYRRNRNQRKLAKILKNGGLPEEIRTEVKKAYKDMQKTFTLINLIKNRELFDASNMDNQSNIVSGLFKIIKA